MSKKVICHQHCPSGGHGSRVGLVLAVIVLAACAAAVRSAAPAIESAARTALEVLMWTAVSVCGLAVLAGVALLASGASRRRARTREAMPEYALASQRVSEPVSAPERFAIEQRSIVDSVADGTSATKLAIEAPKIRLDSLPVTEKSSDSRQVTSPRPRHWR